MTFQHVRIKRRSRLLNPLFQLGLAVVVCVAVPYAIQLWSIPATLSAPATHNTAWAALGALVFGFWLHRSVSALPGMRESSGILPGHLAAFGLALTLILFFRLEYSRSFLAVSFFLSIAWFFSVYLVTQRKAVLKLGIIEGGRTNLFDDMPGVIAVRLELDYIPEGLDAVTADFRHEHSRAWEARLADLTLAGLPVYHSKDLYESLTGRAELEHLSENNLGALGPLATLLAAKQVIDRLIAVPVLVALAPVLLVASLAIRLDSSGPALFRQRRVGYRGREFTVYKFRTMACGNGGDTPHRDHLITREKDQRITRIGRFLRRTRIDELPQIYNILRGEMSWIGPRPEASRLSEWYESEIPFYRYRHVVRPGITGWAQVNQGHVAEITDIRTKLSYDFYYIRNFSVWLDLLIIMKTIKTVFTGFGHK
jgi:lipopolysaccharide/colanic/teichoic acid biosynthesis glycosyltransferase